MPRIGPAKLREVLAGNELFHKLEDSILSRLAENVRFESYPAGTVLFRQGDAPGNCYVIAAGKLGLYVDIVERDKLSDSRHGTPREDKVPNWRHVLSTPTGQASVPGKEDGLSDSSEDRSPEPRHMKTNSRRMHYKRSQQRQKHVIFGNRETIGKRDTLGAGRRRMSLCISSPGLADRGDNPMTRRHSSVSLTAHVSSMLELAKPPPKVRRQRTAEGSSLYHRNSNLGEFFYYIHPGRIIGESALVNNVPRAGSVRCEEDSELIVIRRVDFDRLLKEDLSQKQADQLTFLEEHIPGMRSAATLKRLHHPYHFFRKARFPKGHVFITQGKVEPKAIYLLSSGAIEVLRSDKVQSLPSASSPGSPVGARKSRNGGSTEVRLSRCGEMLPGCLFGTLPLACQEEPFTIVAKEACEVFFIKGKLYSLLPFCVTESVNKYLAENTVVRAHRHCNNVLTQATRGLLPMQTEAAQDQAPTTAGQSANTPPEITCTPASAPASRRPSSSAGPEGRRYRHNLCLPDQGGGDGPDVHLPAELVHQRRASQLSTVSGRRLSCLTELSGGGTNEAAALTLQKPSKKSWRDDLKRLQASRPPKHMMQPQTGATLRERMASTLTQFSVLHGVGREGPPQTQASHPELPNAKQSTLGSRPTSSKRSTSASGFPSSICSTGIGMRSASQSSVSVSPSCSETAAARRSVADGHLSQLQSQPQGRKEVTLPLTRSSSHSASGHPRLLGRATSRLAVECKSQKDR
eukprot:TRINITY_DN22113_c0_g3_i2.p1 TRINITY_DN22113_c0_g3~~TRINITY_DN22113_c0_g3_i2.p1  ORF type:complete len:746 (-),score=82.83 TRINITY_DN22113_c0_g3_i2:245-2482(-)